MLRIFFKSSILFCLLLTWSCGSSDVGTTESETRPNLEPQRATEKSKHLNINILLDFSDRINPRIKNIHPSQKERDIAIVKALCEAFKANVNHFNPYNTNARMSVFFHPEPNDKKISALAAKLNVQCRKTNTPSGLMHNKKVYLSLDTEFSQALNDVYDLAIQAKSYPGSRIFGFMKEEAVRYIQDTSKYRNILVILTDGYVYHSNDKYKEGANRFSYIERNVEHFNRFRDRNVLLREFDKKDYGLINPGVNLKGMEVMVLEVASPDDYPIDYEILRKYWSKWLKEMQVEKSMILKSGQPVYTQREIERFLELN